MNEEPEKPCDVTPPATSDSGGQGGLLADPGHTRADLNLLRRAARENWPVTPERREAYLNRIDGLVGDGATDPNLLVKIGDVLGTFDSLNIQRERIRQQEEDADKPVPGTPGVNVTIHNNLPGAIRVIQREDFYGNDAHEREDGTGDHHPPRLDAPAPDPAKPGEVQDADLR